MAIKNMMVGGLGYLPGGPRWIVTHGLSSQDASPGTAPTHIGVESPGLKRPRGVASQLIPLSSGTHARLNEQEGTQ